MTDREVPQKWIDAADLKIQARILTSVDEDAYADGEWADEIHELAEELWDEDEARSNPESPMMTRNGPVIPWPY